MFKLLHINVSLFNKVLGIEISGIKGEELIILEFVWFGKDFLLNFLDNILFSIVRKIGSWIIKENDKGVSFFSEHILNISTFLFG